MSLADRFRRTPIVLAETVVDDRRGLTDTIDLLQERLDSLEREDRGWLTVGDLTDGSLTRDAVTRSAARARLAWVTHPLIQRAVNLKHYYVWGQGVTIDCRDDAVNPVIQAFMDDARNVDTLFGHQARQDVERALQLDGNLMLGLWTTPATGRVRLRTIPMSQVTSIVCDPQDATVRWFYLREWTETTLTAGGTPTTARKRLYHPDFRYRPAGIGQRVRMFGGVPVDWNAPIMHVRVGSLWPSLWGLAEVHAALPWASAYTSYLEDWATIARALSRYAFNATARPKKVGDAAALLAADVGPGASWVSDGSSRLEPIGKVGATLDSESGKPLAMMVAAATDLPYCVDEDTDILTQRGWLSYRDVVQGDSTLTLNNTTGMAEWQFVDEVCVFPATPREMISIEGQHSSLTTPNHRWPVERPFYGGGTKSIKGWTREWATSETFKYYDRLPLAAECVDLPTEAKYSDALVESVAWFWTEGTICKRRDGTPSQNVSICQAAHAPDRCARIRAALTLAFGPAVEKMPRVGRGEQDGAPRWREYLDDDARKFWLNVTAGEVLQDLAPNRVPRHDFLLSLTKSQLVLFIETSLLADNSGPSLLAQKDRAAAEAFQFACILAGHSTTFRTTTGGSAYRMWQVRIRQQRAFWPGQYAQERVTYNGEVWCPRTANMTWLARRNGSVYFTGNTLLTGDVDQGNLATAKTLDRPTELAMIDRQSLWTSVIKGLCDYVVDAAIRAPRGPLAGRLTADDDGMEVPVLTGDDTDRDVSVRWPPILAPDTPAMIASIVDADKTGKLPPVEVARLLLTLLDVDDVDTVLKTMTDDAGNFIDPGAVAATNAGDQAVRAFRAGTDPASLLR